MTVTIPTLDELFNDMRAFLNARISGLLTDEDTDAGARILMLRDSIFGIYYELAQAEKNIFLSTCDEESLEIHADQRGLPRLGAVGASGANNISVTGDSLSTVNVGDSLSDADGLKFEITKGAVLSGTGPATLSVRAISTGRATNKSAGETLTFDSPGAGVDATATIANAGLAGGADEESIAEWRARLIALNQNPPSGGRFSDYRNWAREVSGVEEAYVFGPSSYAQQGRRGLGTVDVAVLQPGSGAERIPTRPNVAYKSDLEQRVWNLIESRRPAGALDWDIVRVIQLALDVQIEIEAHAEWAFDWAYSPTLKVASYVAGGVTLILQAAPPDNILSKGHRFVIVPGNYSSGNPAEMKTVVSRVGTTLVFDTPFENAVGNNDELIPGGPLTEPATDAIKDYIDSIGPARGVAADPLQVWEDTARVSRFYDSIMDIEGVKDCELIDPVANVEPTDDVIGNTLELLTWRTILIAPKS